MPIWTGGSNGSSGSRIAEAWGGINGGSFVNTALPNNRAYHPDPAFEAAALADLNANVYSYLTGYEPGTSGYPNGLASFPFINSDKFTAVINVISNAELNDPANGIEWMPFYMSKTGRETQSFNQGTRARMEHMGIPIPPGLKPSYNATTGQPDTDGTLIIYLPDWESQAFLGNPAYKGLMINVWGAWDPDANVTRGLPPVWTAKYAGFISGVNSKLNGAGFTRTSGADVTKANGPGYQTVSPPVGARNDDGTFVNGDPNNLNRPDTELAGAFGGPIVGHETKTYPGYGRDGVAVENNYEIPAAHISMSHHIISRRDCARTCPIHGHAGYIDHVIGYMLSTERPNTTGSFVSPAVGYDGASRTGMPQGTRWRLEPGYYVAADKTGWTNYQHMFVCAWERLGLVFLDTTSGTGTSFRAEPGANALISGGLGGSAGMKKLPWADLRMLSVGTTADPNPVTGGTDTTAPTVLSRTPSTGATNVATSSVISVTFSEAVFGVAVGSTFTVTRSGTAVPGTISGTGATRTFTPTSALLQGTTYTVSLTSGITDAAGNTLGATSWSFTTASVATDTTAPTLAVRFPEAGTNAIPIGSDITLTFSEPVQGVTASTFKLNRSDTGAAVSGLVSGSETSYTLNPTTSLDPGTSYIVQLTGGTSAIRDLANNPLTSTSWSFTTFAAQRHPRRTRVRPPGHRVTTTLITATTSISSDTVIVAEGVLS